MSKLDFLSTVKFRFTLDRLPDAVFFSNQVSLPGLSINETNAVVSPLKKSPVPGDRMDYEPFTIQFLVTEDLRNYFEIEEWMRGIGFPDNFGEHAALLPDGLYSDGTLSILSSQQRVTNTIVFKDMYPQSLSSLDFLTNSDESQIPATCSFRYQTWDFV